MHLALPQCQVLKVELIPTITVSVYKLEKTLFYRVKLCYVSNMSHQKVKDIFIDLPT